MNTKAYYYIFLLVIIVTLQSCVYRMDIAQGNQIEVKDLAKVEPGMSKKQVIFLIGKPAIEDLYHANQWDYIYYLKPGGKKITSIKKMRLFFEGDRLTEIRGDFAINDS
ncbi:MAG: outer membrane protein assembly factor BamE [Gammaproteobacteria bacterium]|jgi:outer membrane protein assembly factor BamE